MARRTSCPSVAATTQQKASVRLTNCFGKDFTIFGELRWAAPYRETFAAATCCLPRATRVRKLTTSANMRKLSRTICTLLPSL